MKKSHAAAMRTALTGMLGALALALSFMERLLLAYVPLPPGVKPGLSNIAVLFTVSALGLPYALGLVFIKAAFAFLVSGFPAACMSGCGGLVSVLAMFLLLVCKPKKMSYTGISVISAVLHNAGQLAAASLLTQVSLYRAYAPVLLLSGILFGAVTGVLLNAVLPSLTGIKNKMIHTEKNKKKERG